VLGAIPILVYVFVVCNMCLAAIVIHMYMYSVGCPRNQNIFFDSNRDKPKLNLFRLILVSFTKLKKYFVGFFQFVLVFRNCIRTIEKNRSISKQSKGRGALHIVDRG
jgi:hypothetical protein